MRLFRVFARNVAVHNYHLHFRAPGSAERDSVVRHVPVAVEAAVVENVVIVGGGGLLRYDVAAVGFVARAYRPDVAVFEVSDCVLSENVIRSALDPAVVVKLHAAVRQKGVVVRGDLAVIKTRPVGVYGKRNRLSA